MSRLAIRLLISVFIVSLSLVIYYEYWGSKSDGLSGSRAEWKNREAAIDRLDSRLQYLADQIRASQGESRCKRDDQCRVVGLGAKVCGYFKDFLIYSTQDVEESSLLFRVDEFNRSHEKLIDMTLAVNQCGKKAAIIHCVKQRCIPDVH